MPRIPLSTRPFSIVFGPSTRRARQADASIVIVLSILSIPSILIVLVGLSEASIGRVPDY